MISIPVGASPSISPPSVISRERLCSLIAYLSAHNGVDQHEFYNDHGADTQAAYEFAQKLRSQLGPYLGTVIMVKQGTCRISVIVCEDWGKALASVKVF